METDDKRVFRVWRGRQTSRDQKVVRFVDGGLITVRWFECRVSFDAVHHGEILCNGIPTTPNDKKKYIASFFAAGFEPASSG